MMAINVFIHGAIMFGFCVASLFFYRFWRETTDRLFLYFCFSFGLMSLNRVGFLITGHESEFRTYLYFVRLVAFALIIWAIVEKNLLARKTDSVAQTGRE